MSKSAKKGAYQFHPLELSFVGYSGSGKTTLIEKLVARDFGSVAYVKHDAHSFQVDKEGKDTFRIRAAGARSAFISNAGELCWMASGALSLFQQKSVFLDFDRLFIEGYKALDVDKIVVIDAAGAILRDLPDYERVLAFVGAGDVVPVLPVDRPYFQRDQIDELSDYLRAYFLKKAEASRPLRGLVLAGGQSSRMGQDKSRLKYHQDNQAIHTLRMLKDLGLPSYISLRSGQWPDSELLDLPVLFDRFDNVGPLSGILTAMQTHPEASWLVVACDLPLLSRGALEHLLKARRVDKMATAYRSTSEPEFPEPLCAIYENPIKMRFFEALALGLSCPRKVLLQSNTEMIAPFDDGSLTNVNDQLEASRVRSLLQELPL